MEPIGKQIQKIRKQRKLTQQDLANKSCLSINTIKSIEISRMEPSRDFINKIAEALDCEYVEILKQKEK